MPIPMISMATSLRADPLVGTNIWWISSVKANEIEASRLRLSATLPKER